MTTATIWILDGHSSHTRGLPMPSRYGRLSLYAVNGRHAEFPRSLKQPIQELSGGYERQAACDAADLLGAELVTIHCSNWTSSLSLAKRDGRWRTAPLRLDATTTLGGSRLAERIFDDPDEHGNLDACLRIFSAELRRAFPNVLRRQRIRIVGGPFDQEITA